MWKPITTGVIIALCLLASPPAAAQTETDARELFERGNVFLERALDANGTARTRALREALNWYHRSLRVTRARSVLFNIALCYEHLNRPTDAFSYYYEYLAIRDLAPEDRAAAQEKLDRLRPRVALVEVTSTPPGATIFLDRRDLAPRGVTPATVATGPGRHRVILELEGHEPAESHVDAELGQSRSVALELTPRPAMVTVVTEPPGAQIRVDDPRGDIVGTSPVTLALPAGPHRVFAVLSDQAGREMFEAPPGGQLTVTVALGAPTTPGKVDVEVDLEGATVAVDGEIVGTAPLADLRLPPGRHRFTVAAGSSYQSWSEVVDLGPGHHLHLQVHLAPSEPRRRFGIWPNIGMTAAAVVGITAAALGGWSLALHADFKDIRSRCGESEVACGPGSGLRQEAVTLDRRLSSVALTTDILLGVTAALGITAFALMLLNREIEDASRVDFALAPLPGGVLASFVARGMLGVSR